MGKEKYKKTMNRITGGAAALLDLYDRAWQKLDKKLLIAHYRFAKKVHEDRIKFIEKKEKHCTAFCRIRTGRRRRSGDFQ